MALSLRLPTDCIKTSLSVCIDRCAAARRSQIFQPACCHSGRCKADSGVEVMLLRAQIEAQPLILRVGLLVLMQSADVCLGSTRCCWLKFLLLTHALGQNKGRPGIQINHRPPLPYIIPRNLQPMFKCKQSAVLQGNQEWTGQVGFHFERRAVPNFLESCHQLHAAHSHNRSPSAHGSIFQDFVYLNNHSQADASSGMV